MVNLFGSNSPLLAAQVIIAVKEYSLRYPAACCEECSFRVPARIL
jgi:hypothetical protein